MSLQKGQIVLVAPTNLQSLQKIDDCFPSPSSASSRIQSEMASSDTHQEENNNQPMEEDVSSDEDMETLGSNYKRNERDEEGIGSSGLGSRKKTRSFVWKHLTRLKDDYDRCKCRYCGKEMPCPSKSGTTNLRKHILGCKGFLAWKAAKASKGKGKQTELTPDEEGNLTLYKVSEDVFKEATDELIVLAELPLAFIESLAWRSFCLKVQLHTPVCRKTSTKQIVAMYASRKAKMKKVLGQNKQRLSLTTDIWVAPYTSASYMVITAHFVDASWKLQKMIIGFKNVDDHKGSTIAKVLIDCLAEWDIRRVFCITVDNATANTSAMKKFKEDFMSQGEDALVLNGEFLHIRCATHILNLIVKEGLAEIDDSVIAIRNAIQYVRSSTNRLKSFEFRVESGKMTRGSLPLDVKTRWNSTYLMLDQALKFRLAFEKMESEDKPYNDYFMEITDGKKRIGPPSKSDWEEVERLVHFLVIFYNSTLVLSASKSITSHKIYNEIVTITRNVCKISNAQGPDDSLRYKALSMMGKIRKYWNPFVEEDEAEKSKFKSCKMNKLIIVANVFDPRKKMNFVNLCFEMLYGKESIEYTLLSESVLDILKKLYDEYSLRGSGGSQSQGGSSSQTQDQDAGAAFESRDLGNGIGYERMDNLYEELIQEAGTHDSSNELELYLKEKVETTKPMVGTEYDVLSWWRRNSPKFPTLSRVAADILAVQVSSVASESAFSTSGRVLDTYRSCLTHFMVEVLVCTQQWLKSEKHMKEKGVPTIEQLLETVELEDDLMRANEPEFNVQELP
ncbi:zinc finger BED domain-containing protein RICESLEEPER 2-like [Brassica napus]|uniref:zinc finger BED domain-containing protein RICESLEEPER 2 n=1 Tax=Brassica napus TaxID=3708 RepID=UPI0006AA82B3|nr:zinc finger BED domain-containing protein RICESLEEPER 2 [Brassica napus]XP_022566780.1 zinc finger BED domain-containing protein RICESLEEPER 2-like [Brassica napus]XP_048601881.1 zinc finger BED domain-containing protein RICESLEEPER 2-like [Brassica napus]XP_048622454.1 zinc finger BED domain-containing protein RICESLEEPER 2-like [Brassica napus]